MKKFILLLIVSSSINMYAQSVDRDAEAILNVIKDQESAWNNYDIDTFMESYWKSDSLKFFGSNGIIYGWDKTLERYNKSYPTKEHFGKLNFVIKSISKINDGSYYVMGEYHLKRPIGNADGFFMIIFKKIDDEWKIIADTTAKL